MWSFGFQKLFAEKKDARNTLFFNKCHASAKEVVRIMIDELTHSGYMKYAPDGYFVFAAFASAFLIKIIRPRPGSPPLLSKSEETSTVELISRLIQTFSSPDIAVDEKHTPRLYALFLTALLTRQRSDGPTMGQLQTQPPPHASLSPDEQHRQLQQGTFFSGGGYTNSGFGSGSLQQPMQGGGGGAGGAPVFRLETQFQPGLDHALEIAPDGGMEYETLTSMKAINNPNWWESMMMPG
jgi:hypothetical protein